MQNWQRVSALLLMGALAGCASSPKSDLALEWKQSIPEESDTVMIEPGGAMVAGKDKRVALYGADKGRRLYLRELEEGLFDVSKLSIGGLSLAGLNADNLRYLFMPGLEMLLVFDQSGDRDSIRAVDLNSGAERWRNDEYRWSMKHQRLFQGLAEGVLSGKTGGKWDLQKDRYVYALGHELPQKGALLLSTAAGLRLVDAKSGKTRWTVKEINGTGIKTVRYLPEQDELLVATDYSDLLEWSAGGVELVRIDATNGKRLWATPYGDEFGAKIRRLRVEGDRVILDMYAGMTDVFDYRSGKRLLHTQAGGTGTMSQQMGANMLGSRYTSTAAIDSRGVYVPYTTNAKMAGQPDKTVIKYSLRNGKQLWQGDLIAEVIDVRDLHVVGDSVIGRVVSAGEGMMLSPDEAYQYVVAWRRSDGKIRWKKRLSTTAVLNRHTIVEGAGEPGVRPEGLVIDNDGLLVVDRAALYRLDPDSGKVLKRTAYDSDKLGAVWQLVPHEQGLIALHREGVSLWDKKSLAIKAQRQTGSLQYWVNVNGDKLFVNIEGEQLLQLKLTNLKQQGRIEYVPPGGSLYNGRNIDDFAPFDPGMALIHNGAGVARGAYIADGGDAVYILHENKNLYRYRAAN